MSVPSTKFVAASFNSAGWVVELQRCSHLDDPAGQHHWFAVNLIAPQSGATSDWTRETPLPAVTCEQAMDALEDQLFPWKWGKWQTQWKVYGQETAGGTWKPVSTMDLDAGTDPVLAADTTDLLASFEDEVGKRAAGCRDAFSLVDERWQGHPKAKRLPGDVAVIEQSLVHALAPPTHAPVPLSNRVFRYAGFVKLAQTEFAKYVQFAAFPLVKIAGQTFEPNEVKDHATTPGVVVGNYQPAAIRSTALIFQCFASDGKPHKISSLKFEVKLGSLARDVIAPVFASCGMPLETLANAVAAIVCAETIILDGKVVDNPDWSLMKEDGFPQQLWQHVLVCALGSGWFRMRGKSQGAHVLQYATSGSDIDERERVFPGTLENYFKGPVNAASSAEWLAQLRDELNARSRERSSPEGLLLDALKGLCTPVNGLPANEPNKDRYATRRTQAQVFFRSWAHVALEFLGDRRPEAFKAWLAMLIRRCALQGAPQEAVQKICTRLDALIGLDVTDRLLLGTLDAGQASQIWDRLKTLVDANEDPALETKAVDAIKLWSRTSIASMLTGLGPVSTTEVYLTRAMEDLLVSFREQGHRLIRRDYDEGLLVCFDALESSEDSNQIDEFMRGFAVALRSGVRDGQGQFHADSKHAAWVTQTAIVRYSRAMAPQWLHGEDGTVIEASGTIGSASRDGQRIVQFSYRGNPIFANGVGIERNPDGADDADDFHSLDYRWLSTTALPLLGYGSEFQGICTAIDNGGGIVDAQYRATALPGTPISARDLPGTLIPAQKLLETCWHPTTLNYRSCVAPGAPKLVGVAVLDKAGRVTTVDPWELSDQTRATRYVSQQLQAADAYDEKKRLLAKRAVAAGGALPRVACIAPPVLVGPSNEPLFRADRPRTVRVTVGSPSATKDFVRAWLATDQLSWRTGVREFSDPNFGQVTADELDRFVVDVTHKRNALGEVAPESEYHPAVSAIGVEFDFGDQFARIVKPPVMLERTRVASGKLSPAPYKSLSIDVSVEPAKTNPTLDASDPFNQVLTVPAGCFVRVRCFVLVSEVFFAGTSSLHRYFDQLPHEQAAFANFRAFGPYEIWVEALPLWKHEPAPTTAYFPLRVSAPDAAFPDRQRLLLTPANTLQADWIRAVNINRHAWHWTGYPVCFPQWSQREELKTWLPAFAGVESNREQSTLELPTRLTGRSWQFGDARSTDVVLHEHRLRSGERPSQYAAYTLKPTVRFSSWLNPKLTPGSGGPKDLEIDIFAAGNAIEGVGAFSESQRLPPPAFEYRIPLTATYMYDANEVYGGLHLARGTNGNLLIFNDALRRTDSLTRTGGLGDTIEVDLIQVRHVIAPGSDLVMAQIGPNPIFHASPSAGGTVPSDYAKHVLMASEPHGLTYDVVRNAKVAQTAILVQPAIWDAATNVASVEQASEQWQLAQVRVRRMILPETQLNAMLVPLDVAAHPLEFPLPWRRSGIDRIPHDFAVEVDDTSMPALRVLAKRSDTSQDYTLSLPTVARKNARVRFLVSFHKGRWDSAKPDKPFPGVPYWAAQVYAQRQRPDRGSLSWTTIGKVTCDGADAWQVGAGALSVVVSGATAPIAYRVQMSDYTDARWLLFIGRIPGTGKQPPEEYLLTPRELAGKVRLSLARGAFARLPAPPQRDQWGTDDVEFFVLLVSSPSANVMTGASDAGYQGLLAFRPLPRVVGDPVEFELMGDAGDLRGSLDMLAGATAVLCSFQRITATSVEERKSIDSFSDLVQAIFPDEVDSDDPAHVLESLIRPTGNHWGPMRIGRPV